MYAEEQPHAPGVLYWRRLTSLDVVAAAFASGLWEGCWGGQTWVMDCFVRTASGGGHGIRRYTYGWLVRTGLFEKKISDAVRYWHSDVGSGGPNCVFKKICSSSALASRQPPPAVLGVVVVAAAAARFARVVVWKYYCVACPIARKRHHAQELRHQEDTGREFAKDRQGSPESHQSS